jgi:hypothetical protein
VKDERLHTIKGRYFTVIMDGLRSKIEPERMCILTTIYPNALKFETVSIADNLRTMKHEITRDLDELIKRVEASNDG